MTNVYINKTETKRSLHHGVINVFCIDWYQTEDCNYSASYRHNVVSCHGHFQNIRNLFQLPGEMFEGNSEEENFNIPIPRQFAEQISPQAFQAQKRVYTNSAVSDLQKSKEYKEWHQRCSSCGSSWFNGQWSSQCRECGGFSMIRPCAICNGHCGSTWHRDVDMSHRMKEGYWNGQCNLPESEQTHFILQNFVDNKEDTLIEAFGDLGKR